MPIEENAVNVVPIAAQPRPGLLFPFQLAETELEFMPYAVPVPEPTAVEMLGVAGRHPPDGYVLLRFLENGELEVLAPDQKVDLRPSSTQKFLALLTDRLYLLNVDGARKEWGAPLISGLTVKKLAGIDPATHGLLLLVQGSEPREIPDQELVDLAKPGIEHFETFRKPHKVTVTLDSRPKEIWAGEYTVPDLKKALDVPAAKELEQVINGVLTPLADDAKVIICGGEIFVSHTKHGGSAWTRSPDDLATLTHLGASVVPMQEAGMEYICLKGLQTTIAGTPMELDVLLCPDAGGRYGYPTKLFISREVASLLARIPNRQALNWNCTMVLFGRQWYSWSWNDVPPSLPLLEMLMNHLRALQ